MCKSKGLTKPEGEVKAKVWRRIAAPSAMSMVASTELILLSHAGDRRKLRAHDCLVRRASPSRELRAGR